MRDMATASIKFSGDFVVEAWRLYRAQHRWRWVVLTARIAPAVLFGSVGVWSWFQGDWLLSLLLLGFCAFVFCTRWIGEWWTRWSFRKSPYCDEDLTIELTEAGFHAWSAKQDARLQWSAFTKVAQFGHGFLLFQGPRLFNWIPVTALGDPSQVHDLEALLRSKISEYRVVDAGGDRVT